jgi:hypothetical protein
VSQERILAALGEAQHLTVSQVARLFYAVRADGSPAVSAFRRPRPDDEYQLTPGYGSAYDMLKRMVKDRAVRKHKSDVKGGQDLYSLHEDAHYPARGNFDHEVACGDLYVAFRQTGKVATWSTRWKPHQRDSFAKATRINPDAVLELEGASQVIFFEVDLGNEGYQTLDKKVKKYRDLATLTSAFAVVFLFKDNARRGCYWKERAVQFNARVGAKHERGKQFSAACHSMLVEDPFGKLVFSYKSKELFSVLDLAR